MKLPSYNLLYFKNLLDIAFIKFFQEYNNYFIKDENNNYILTKAFNLTQLESFFCKIIEQTLEEIVQPYDLIKFPVIYFIIGSCMPRDNFLLKFKDNYFPQKIELMIKSKYQIKYFLKEKDIKIDIIKFNEACLNVFNAFFNNQILSKKYKNVIFITNNNLDCYSIFKIIKYIYGKNNCKNLYLDHFKKNDSPIISVNDMIDKYVNNKNKANKDQKFKNICLEMKQFLDLRISDIRNGK